MGNIKKREHHNPRRVPSYQDRVKAVKFVKALADSKRSFNTVYVHKHTGVCRVVEKLMEAGVLTKVGRGRYEYSSDLSPEVLVHQQWRQNNGTVRDGGGKMTVSPSGVLTPSQEVPSFDSVFPVDSFRVLVDEALSRADKYLPANKSWFIADTLLDGLRKEFQ